MEKQIQLGTPITDNGTNIKYSIIEIRKDGFVCKSISSAKKIPNEEFTFEEIAKLFTENNINIGDFEHTDADNRLVDLLMQVYIKDSLIGEFKDSVNVATLDKNNLSVKFSEQELLLAEKDKTIEDQESGIKEKETKIEQHEKTISEQQTTMQEQKDFIQGQKDELETLENQKSQWLIDEQEYKNTIAGLESTVES